MDLRDRWVTFRIRDVFIPDPRGVLLELYGGDLLQGLVLDLSDGGKKREAYAVVSVEAVEQPLIVPVDRIASVL